MAAAPLIIWAIVTYDCNTIKRKKQRKWRNGICILRCQGNSGNLSANMIYLQLFTRVTSQSPRLHENLATAAIKRFGRILPNKLFLWFVAFFHKGSLACRQFHPGRAVAAGDKEENGYCFNPETTIGIIFGELTAPYQSEGSFCRYRAALPRHRIYQRRNVVQIPSECR